MIITAQTLKITAEEETWDRGTLTREYYVYELPAPDPRPILDLGNMTQGDVVFENRQSIEYNANSVLKTVEEDGTRDFTLNEIIKILTGSEIEFGSGSVPMDAWRFVRDNIQEQDISETTT